MTPQRLKNENSWQLTLLLVSGLGILVGCGSSGSQPAPAEPAPVAADPATAEPEPDTSSTAEAETEAQTEAESATPTSEPTETPASEPYDLTAYEAVLQAYVTADGGVRYAALAADDGARDQLATFVATIATAAPDPWTRDHRLAFFINAYNALVLHSVVERWPIPSVMRVPGFFDRLRHQVAGSSITLNQLENGIIRGDEFSEPRIHFAVNCASTGCPPLSRQAYRSVNLDASLTAQTQSFVRRTSRIQGRSLRVTKLFEWFVTDFGGRDGVRRFLVEHLDGESLTLAQNNRTTIGTFPYDWDINSRD